MDTNRDKVLRSRVKIFVGAAGGARRNDNISAALRRRYAVMPVRRGKMECRKFRPVGEFYPTIKNALWKSLLSRKA